MWIFLGSSHSASKWKVGPAPYVNCYKSNMGAYESTSAAILHGTQYLARQKNPCLIVEEHTNINECNITHHSTHPQQLPSPSYNHCPLHHTTAALSVLQQPPSPSYSSCPAHVRLAARTILCLTASGPTTPCSHSCTLGEYRPRRHEKLSHDSQGKGCQFLPAGHYVQKRRIKRGGVTSVWIFGFYAVSIDPYIPKTTGRKYLRISRADWGRIFLWFTSYGAPSVLDFAIIEAWSGRTYVHTVHTYIHTYLVST